MSAGKSDAANPNDRPPETTLQALPPSSCAEAVDHFFAEALVNQCPLGIAIFATDGTLLRTNAALRTLVGAPASEHPLGIFNVKDDPLARVAGADAAFERALKGEVVRIDNQLLDLGAPENAWRSHGRKLRLNSQWFPLRDGQGAVRAVAVTLRGELLPEPPPEPGPLDPKSTILFVDDEPMIRQFAHTVLTAKGYRVILAEDGDEALDKYAKYAGRIGLVILDLTMPRMTGQELFKELRKRHPDAYVLFSSGYSEEPSDQGEGVAGFLPKPYRPQELLDAVREAMEAK